MPDRHIAVACILVLLTGAGISMCHEARAQSGEHGHGWYEQLKTPHGYSCCNGDQPGKPGDCRPVQARPRDDGSWEAFFGGQWRPVPPERILPDRLNLVPLHAHICEQDGFVRCFLKGGAGG